MNRGRPGPTLWNNTQDDLIFILTDQQDTVRSRKLDSPGPNVIARRASNSIKDGHNQRSPSPPPNPLALVREGNSSARLRNYGKQSFAGVYRAMNTTMHALTTDAGRHLYPYLTERQSRPV